MFRTSLIRTPVVLVALLGLAGCGEDAPIEGGNTGADVTVDTGGVGGIDADAGGQDAAPLCTDTSCDDKNACTEDKCDPAKGCSNTAKDGACDDGDACTTGDACKDGKCGAGAKLSCDDANPCSDDSCDPTKGCVQLANTASCTDDDACTTGDACKDLKCAPGAAVACDDGNPCTDDACEKVAGCGSKPNAAACSDDDACTAGDACKDGKCGAGTGSACDDKNPCTDDKCDAATGNCVYLASAATCSDGDDCTAQDECVAGKCAGQPSCGCSDDAGCNDNNPCTADTCKDTQCAFVDLGKEATCTDGNDCTEADACDAGACAPGKAKACDDSNACTDDACLPGLGCVNSQTDDKCDDGKADTTGDTCKAGVCVGVPAGCKADADCDDKDPCTANTCAAGKCQSKAAAAGTACDDGNGCTASDACTNGVCLAGKPLACDDQNPCTDDGCDPKAGKCVNKNNTTPCNDGSACTLNDACLDGKCAGGPAPKCDDKNVCTDDSCDPAKGCQYNANVSKCDDGNACTTEDTCKDAVCKGGAAPVCDDKNLCTDDACDPKKGCTAVDNTAPCDDANACTTKDTCGGGKCLGGAAPDCDDKNLCSTDSCDLATGCTHTDNTLGCDDGDACTTKDTCAGSKCVGGVAPDCNDDNPCTTDSCDKVKGCGNVNLKNGSVCAAESCDGLAHFTASTCFSGFCLPGAKSNCDDGNGCTDDTCDPAAGCKKVANAKPCDDGTVCTDGDACKGGSCVAGKAVVCDDANDCSNDSCDPQKGCQAVNASDDTVCKQPSCLTGVYDKGSLCKTGQCTAIASPKSCDDKNPCTDDLCSPTAGCSYQNNTAKCDDGNACTVEDACLGAVCSGGKALNCDDKNACTDDKCDTGTGCVVTSNTAPCDDGDVCTKDDVCKAAKCVSGLQISCDDKNTCTTDKCDPLKGCFSLNNTDGCDDGNACNSGDVCKDGVCKGLGGKNCDDGNPCTLDTCDLAGGCVNKNAVKGLKCSGSSCASDGFHAAATCDGAGLCQDAPKAESCDDKNACTTDICNAQQGCLYANNSAGCDDGNACTVSDSCANGGCSGNKKSCDDGNVCTDDLCDTKTGCTPTANSALCDDASKCTTKDQCADSKCVGDVPPDCDDNNPCTNDSCEGAKGCVHVNNTNTCDDGDACSTADKCTSSKCVGGPAPDCDDKNVCTTDACDALKGCVHSANTSVCDDGSACTTKDACANSKCVGGVAPNCDDANPCTDDSCDAAKGCVNANNTKPCDDKSACTTEDTCGSGKCLGGVAPNCDDKNVCTDDSCDNAKGCVNDANTLSCDDKNACTKNDTCAAKKCVGGAAPNCDDANLCTDDSCNSSVGCKNDANTVPCDDGTACTTKDTCAAAKCVGGAAPNCDDLNPCTTDSCDKVLGCLNTNIAGPCDDGNGCSDGDKCANGKCAGKGIVCDDDNPCTSDTCTDPKVGCVFTNNTLACTDKSFCTTTDVCKDGKCVPGPALDCDDKNPCTDDACDPAKACTHLANVAPCDDKNACTTKDTCNTKICVGGAAPNCDDGNPCTDDSCDSTKGCVNTANTAPCDDKNACTTKDTCAVAKCVGGVAPNCDDANVCTGDSCDPAKGCVNANVSDGIECLKSSCSTLTYQAKGTCLTGKCSIPATKNCNDAVDCTTDSCDATTGCGNVTKAWGTTCVAADATLNYPFCAGNLCTGFEVKVQQSGGSVSTGVLSGIDRFAGGKIYASGWDNNLDPTEGVMSGVSEAPLSLSFNASNNVKSTLRDVRNRLAVGSNQNGNGPVAMGFDVATGIWKNSFAPTFNLTRGLTAVDMFLAAAGVETYVVGGLFDNGQTITTTAGRVSRSTAGWGPFQRFYVATGTGAACSSQVAMEVSDVYAASGTAVYLAGFTIKNGAPDKSVVAFYDGNTTVSCGAVTGFSGIAVTDTAAIANDLTVQVAPAAVPSVGAFRAIHGTGAGHVMAVGSHGTIYSYDAGTWTQQIPNYAGIPVAWGPAFDVRSVDLKGNEAWVGGEYNYLGANSACRALFFLHGAFDPVAGTWAWNKLWLTTKNLETCSSFNVAPTSLRRTWSDGTSGAVYSVGSQGTNNSGTVVTSGATQTRQLIIRVKTK